MRTPPSRLKKALDLAPGVSLSALGLAEVLTRALLPSAWAGGLINLNPFGAFGVMPGATRGRA